MALATFDNGNMDTKFGASNMGSNVFGLSGIQNGISAKDKGKVLKGSSLLLVCFFTYSYWSVKAIPQVVCFSYMLWAGACAMVPALRQLVDGNDVDECKKRSGENGISKVLNMMLKRPFQTYSVFLVGCFIAYLLKGGNPMTVGWRNGVAFVSCILEGFGLISLRSKIALRGHVKGLSGMSMIMFTLTYSMREFEAFFIARVQWNEANIIFLEVLQMSSMLMSWTVLIAIFKTYRTSYQDDLDVLKVKYLIPGCLLLALVLHPNFRRGHTYSLSWTSSFYIDTLALLPQVVMMSRGNGKVEAPIAHFVAATMVSRTFDLAFWYDRYAVDGLHRYFVYHVTLSGVIVAFFHLVSFALVGDFMYYYFKIRISGANMSEDIKIDTDDIC